MNEQRIRYRNQVTMLLSLLPIVMRENNFALHGGTAINLFREDMPRYSVDIDLTYVNIEDWDTTMHNINGSLDRIVVNCFQNCIFDISETTKCKEKCKDMLCSRLLRFEFLTKS